MSLYGTRSFRGRRPSSTRNYSYMLYIYIYTHIITYISNYTCYIGLSEAGEIIMISIMVNEYR